MPLSILSLTHCSSLKAPAFPSLNFRSPRSSLIVSAFPFLTNRSPMLKFRYSLSIIRSVPLVPLFQSRKLECQARYLRREPCIPLAIRSSHNVPLASSTCCITAPAS